MITIMTNPIRIYKFEIIKIEKPTTIYKLISILIFLSSYNLYTFKILNVIFINLSAFKPYFELLELFVKHMTAKIKNGVVGNNGNTAPIKAITVNNIPNAINTYLIYLYHHSISHF